MELERAAADRLAVQACDQQQPPAGGGALGSAEMLRAGSKPASKRRVDLGEVLRQAKRARGVVGVDDVELDERRGEQPLDLAHRRDEPLARRSLSGASSDAASSSLRRSSSVALARPAAVSRAVRTRRSPRRARP